MCVGNDEPGKRHEPKQSERKPSMPTMPSRRSVLAGLSLAGAVGLVGVRSSCADEAPPEITTIRIAKPSAGSICMAPQYAAEALLRAEGFTDVRYVAAASTDALMARGQVDFSLNFAASLVLSIEAGDPITVLAGVHAGCFELFGNEHIHSIADLRGKSVGVRALGSSAHVFLSVMAVYVGLDPAKDINWVANPAVRPIELFADGKIDAFLGFPPDPQEVRARNLGRVIVNSTLDHPWSQYFCCMLEGNGGFVDAHPIATKRVVRAILKATDLCASAPEEVAQWMVDRGVAARYDYALQALNEVPYGNWQEGDPEDTLRFYALRLHEAGMIKSDPKTIIAKGTEWRFLNELRRELKS